LVQWVWSPILNACAGPNAVDLNWIDNSWNWVETQLFILSCPTLPY
jgi:hypothetical protein